MEYGSVLQQGQTWRHCASEKSQSENTTYCMIPFFWNVRNGKSIETENRRAVAYSWGDEETGEWCLHRCVWRTPAQLRDLLLSMATGGRQASGGCCGRLAGGASPSVPGVRRPGFEPRPPTGCSHPASFRQVASSAITLLLKMCPLGWCCSANRYPPTTA